MMQDIQGFVSTELRTRAGIPLIQLLATQFLFFVLSIYFIERYRFLYVPVTMLLLIRSYFSLSSTHGPTDKRRQQASKFSNRHYVPLCRPLLPGSFQGKAERYIPPVCHASSVYEFILNPEN